MEFSNFQEYLKEIDKEPPSDAYVIEDGIKWLKQSYAINQMNEVYGEGNWNIENIRKQELRNEQDQFFGSTCVLTVTFKHPIDGTMLSRDGVSGTEKEAIDNNVIGKAFLNAISSIGRTFGRGLLYQFE
jgi:hypothetical protein